MKSDRRNPSPGPRSGLLILLALVFSVPCLQAQRVRIGSSNPSGLTGAILQDDVIFAAGDAANGVELWQHKGTQTKLVADVYPGKASSFPDQIVRSGLGSGETWFVARQPASGRELHHYPTLTNPTRTLVADIRKGKLGSHPADLTVLGARLFFTAEDGIHGRELWVADARNGAKLVADLVVGKVGSRPFGLTAYNGKVYFAATLPKTGTELWCTDGTANGTTLVRDIATGAASSTPSGMTEVGGRLYFAAQTALLGRELWSTDGTKIGTVLAADIAPGTASSSPSQLTRGLRLAFTAWEKGTGRQLYLFNGFGKPLRVSNLPRGETISEITSALFIVWFRAFTKAGGFELWRTTSAGGVEQVHDLRPGVAGSSPSNLVPFGSKLLFRANDGKTGQEMWMTDGRTAKLLLDIRTGPDDSFPSKPVRIGFVSPRFFFAAKRKTVGVEYWQFDGTNTTLVKDIDPLPALPEMHLDLAGGNLVIDVKDAGKNKAGALIIGFGAGTPITFPFLRGALALDTRLPTIIVPYRTDNAGVAGFRFPAPARGVGGIPIGFQAFVETSPTLDGMTTFWCTSGENSPATPNGATVHGEICVDDETGEYQISATRLDANAAPAYIGLYRVSVEPGEMELIECFPIEFGDTVDRNGRLELKLRLIDEDAAGDALEMHIFDTEPTSGTPTPASKIVQSYC